MFGGEPPESDKTSTANEDGAKMARDITVLIVKSAAWLLFAIIAFAGPSQAATCTSLASGNWNVAANWSCGSVPNDNDDVVIDSSHTVTLDAVSNRLNSLTLNVG